MPLLTQKCINR